MHLPAGGPNTPRRRFSTLPSSVSCVMFADVCAENVIASGMMRSEIFSPATVDEPERYCEMLTVLPVPVSPTMST